MPMTVAAIILAAGASRRLGQPKQLLLLAGETLLERALRLAKVAGAAPVFAVLGAHFEAICATVQLGDAVLVLNDRWEQGLATSIHAGLRATDACAKETPGVLMMSCDQPRITSEHLRGLIAAFGAETEPTIIASAYGGVQGVPALFPRMTFLNLYGLHGDEGARALLAKPPCPVIALPFDGGDVDIDLSADLERLG